MPAISIVIPIYNVEQYLRQCLDSVLDQSFEDYEVWLVENGSGDMSGAICDEYSQRDSRFKVYHTKQKGACLARNIGIKLAQGEWLTFLDSDDFIDNDYLKHLFAPTINNPNLQMVLGGGVKIFLDKTSTYNGVIGNKSQDVEYSSKWLTNNTLTFLSEKLFNISFLRSSGVLLNEKMKAPEDTEFFLRFLPLVASFAVTNDYDLNYRVREGSLTFHKWDYQVALNDSRLLLAALKESAQMINVQITEHNVHSVVANKYFVTIKILYIDELRKSDRIAHLKDDFTDEERRLIYCKQFGVMKRIMIWFLVNRHYYFFDFLMSQRSLINKLPKTFRD